MYYGFAGENACLAGIHFFQSLARVESFKRKEAWFFPRDASALAPKQQQLSYISPDKKPLKEIVTETHQIHRDIEFSKAPELINLTFQGF